MTTCEAEGASASVNERASNQTRGRVDVCMTCARVTRGVCETDTVIPCALGLGWAQCLHLPLGTLWSSLLDILSSWTSWSKQ